MTLGSDFAGGTELDAALSLQSGQRALGDAIIRRLTTPRGGIPDFPAYGFDVGSLIGRTLTPNAIAQLVLEQVRAEEEVEEAALDVEQSDDGSTITLSIRVVAADGPFDLTLSIDDLGVTAIIPGEE